MTVSLGHAAPSRSSASEKIGPAVSLALGRDDMDEDASLQVLRLAQRLHDLVRVVAVDRAEVSHTQIFKHHFRDKELLDTVFHIADAVHDIAADSRETAQPLLDLFLQVVVGCGRTERA